MSWMGSHGVGLGAGSAPAGLRRKAARWAAGGTAAAATVAAGMMAAPSAMAVATIPVPCSVAALNGAIALAPSNAILVLRSGCVYRLTAKLPTITRNLTIEGSNDTITAFTGSYTILTNNGAVVSLNRLRITDADHTSGLAGAIFNTGGGALSLTSVTLADNEGPNGGAVYNDTSSSLTVASSTFADNEATAGGIGGGGAIANAAGNVTVSGTTFVGNDAENGAGGAIHSLGGTVTLQSPASGFTDNFADKDGGAIDAILGTLNVTKATFNGNVSDDDGGAVANFGAASTIAQSGFTGNRASDDGGAVADASVLDLTSDLLSANRAGHNGGGLFVAAPGHVTLDTTDIIGNRAGNTGGGIRRNTGASVSFLNTTLVLLNFPNNCSNLICPA
jgi:hypothetical protein